MRTIQAKTTTLPSMSATHDPNVANQNALSDEEAATLLDCLRTMHEIVRDKGAELPDWSECSGKDQEYVFVRSIRLLARRADMAKENKVRKLRDSLNMVFDQHMLSARKTKVEFDSLSPALKKLMGKATFPDTIQVPISSVSGCFPTTLTEDQLIHNLTNMFYKVLRTKDKSNTAYILLPFIETQE